MSELPRTVASLVEEGLRLYSAGRLDQALRCWQQALRAEPQHQLARQYIQYVETHRQALVQAFDGGAAPPRAAHPAEFASAATPGRRGSVPGLPRLQVPPVSVAVPEPEPAFGEAPNYELATDAATPKTIAPQRRTGERLALNGDPASDALVVDWGGDLPTSELLSEDEVGPLASEALVQQSAGGDGSSKAPIAVPAAHADPFARARAFFLAGELEAALPLLGQLLQGEPNHSAARELQRDCQQALVSQYEQVLIDLHAVPVVQVPPQQVLWQKLDHRAGFVLSRVDGVLSYEDILDISGMSHLEACRILAQLVQQGVIAPAG